MKGLMKYLAVGLSVLIMAALLVGCAKPPTAEMDAAKVAMDGRGRRRRRHVRQGRPQEHQ